MRVLKITSGGQVSIPSTIRRRWEATAVRMEDLGDRIVLTPAPGDPVAVARGALLGQLSQSSRELRARARWDEARAERHRHNAGR